MTDNAKAPDAPAAETDADVPVTRGELRGLFDGFQAALRDDVTRIVHHGAAPGPTPAATPADPGTAGQVYADSDAGQAAQPPGDHTDTFAL